ncbi:MAG: PaaI family thioesterase [Anaerolineae bacterium]
MALNKQPNSRMCFICGLQNPIGLRMALYNDADNQQVVSTVTIPAHFQGYPGVAHGGIVASLLDEVAGRALLLTGSDEELMVTIKLDVKYRQPTPTLTPLKVIGRVESISGNRAKTYGEIRLPDGTVTAEANLLLTRPTRDFREQWVDEKPYWKVYPDA